MRFVIGIAVVVFLVFGVGWFAIARAGGQVRALENDGRTSRFEEFHASCQETTFSPACWSFDGAATLRLQATKGRVASIQKALAGDGKYVGPVDGTANRELMNALMGAGFGVPAVPGEVQENAWSCMARYYGKLGKGDPTEIEHAKGERAWPDYCESGEGHELTSLKTKPAFPQ